MNTEPCPRCRELGNDTRGDNLVVWPDGGKFCFSCRLRVPAPWTGPRRTITKTTHEKTSLPIDFTREVPASAWQWVLQYGLPYSYWQAYCGYSPTEERLIFCVPDIHSVSFSQGRYVGNPQGGADGGDHRGSQVPQGSGLRAVTDHSQVRPGEVAGSGLRSSLQDGTETEESRLGRSGGSGMHRSRDRGDDNQVGKAPAKWFTWGDCHKSAHVYGDYQQVPSVVLVEDIVSAHKVGQVNACIPLFGTQVHEPVLACLRHIGLPIILWQDKDQRPFIQKRAAALSVLTNLPVSYMFTDKDPKSIPINEIKELLK